MPSSTGRTPRWLLYPGGPGPCGCSAIQTRPWTTAAARSPWPGSCLIPTVWLTLWSPVPGTTSSAGRIRLSRSGQRQLLPFRPSKGFLSSWPGELSCEAGRCPGRGRRGRARRRYDRSLSIYWPWSRCYLFPTFGPCWPRLLLMQGGGGAEAEACFHQALEISRRQQAKSLELRAAMSLSRLWRQQGKKSEARQMLQEIYGWFTEGFDTADLQDAKALLEELA